MERQRKNLNIQKSTFPNNQSKHTEKSRHKEQKYIQACRIQAWKRISNVTTSTHKSTTNQNKQIVEVPSGYYKHYDYSNNQHPHPTLTYSTNLLKIVTMTFKPNLLTICSEHKNWLNETKIACNSLIQKTTARTKREENQTICKDIKTLARKQT